MQNLHGLPLCQNNMNAFYNNILFSTNYFSSYFGPFLFSSLLRQQHSDFKFT
jgi:hypothetical protein